MVIHRGLTAAAPVRACARAATPCVTLGACLALAVVCALAVGTCNRVRGSEHTAGRPRRPCLSNAFAKRAYDTRHAHLCNVRYHCQYVDGTIVLTQVGVYSGGHLLDTRLGQLSPDITYILFAVRDAHGAYRRYTLPGICCKSWRGQLSVG